LYFRTYIDPLKKSERYHDFLNIVSRSGDLVGPSSDDSKKLEVIAALSRACERLESHKRFQLYLRRWNIEKEKIRSWQRELEPMLAWKKKMEASLEVKQKKKMEILTDILSNETTVTDQMVPGQP
jgi:hypothetical protein